MGLRYPGALPKAYVARVEPALGRAVRGITACPGLGIQLLALPVVIVIRRLAFPL